jgi:hypothetical protein
MGRRGPRPHAGHRKHRRRRPRTDVEASPVRRSFQVDINIEWHAYSVEDFNEGGDPASRLDLPGDWWVVVGHARSAHRPYPLVMEVGPDLEQTGAIASKALDEMLDRHVGPLRWRSVGEWS